MKRTLLAILAGVIAAFVLAGTASGLSAEPSTEDGLILALGEPEEIPLTIEPTPTNASIDIEWSAAGLGLGGNLTAPADATGVRLPVRSTNVGVEEVRVDVSQANETVRLTVPAASLPRLQAGVVGLGTAPKETGHLYAQGPRTFQVHVTSRSPIPFTTNFTYRSGEASVHLEPNETTILEGELSPEERATRIGVLLNLQTGDRSADPLQPDAKRAIPEMHLHLHRNPTVIPQFEPVLAETPEGPRLEATLELIPVGVDTGFEGVLRAAPSGPPLDCAQPTERRISADFSEPSRTRSVSIPWTCAADALLRVWGTIEGRATPIEPVTKRFSVPHPTPNVTSPATMSTSTQLPTVEGWRTLLWPGFDQESYRMPGPAIPADAFTDADGTPARSGEFGVWLVQDEAAAKIGEVTVDGFPTGVAAAIGPVAFVVALIPLTRFP